MKQPNLWRLLVTRDRNLGGVLTMSTGRLGSGKSNALVHICRRLFDKKVSAGRALKKCTLPQDSSERYALRLVANEKVFWLGGADCQFNRVPRWITKRIYVEKGLDLKFFKDGELFDPMPIPFSSLKELVKLAQPNELNVVFLKDPGRQRDFIESLITSTSMRWASVFADESEAMCPGYETGKIWHEIDKFVRVLKRSRKRRVSLYAGTQTKSLLDFKFIAAISYWLFHIGARSIPQTRVKQFAIDSLKINQAWLASGGSFQKVRLPLYQIGVDLVVQGLTAYKPPESTIKPVSTANEGGESG